LAYRGIDIDNANFRDVCSLRQSASSQLHVPLFTRSWWDRPFMLGAELVSGQLSDKETKRPALDASARLGYLEPKWLRYSLKLSCPKRPVSSTPPDPIPQCSAERSKNAAQGKILRKLLRENGQTAYFDPPPNLRDHTPNYCASKVTVRMYNGESACVRPGKANRNWTDEIKLGVCQCRKLRYPVVTTYKINRSDS
jgi:hypothetical protein